MTLSLTLREPTNIPLEVEGLTPDWVADKSLTEVERFEVYHGNRQLPLAELFTVSGDPSDQRIDFFGPLDSVHWIGAHMKTGEIYVHGSTGRHVGSQMGGGRISVQGNARGWVGAEMRNGLIHIQGDAGHLTGASYRGSVKGMMGGMILVEGSAGNEVGLAMRRGVIAIRGAVGDAVGFNMLAGTIVVLGECGIRPGANMRRGTLALLGENPPPLLPTFRHAGRFPMTAMTILFRLLAEKGFSLTETRPLTSVELYHGDMVSLGRGEIMLR
jgi:formylmethanofuran dehydrogenase subunit C